MKISRVVWAGLLVAGLGVTARADGPADNQIDNVRKIPPPGVAVPAADRSDLESMIGALGEEVQQLRTALKGRPALLDLLPDVQIYHNAARYALQYDEFFNVREIAAAKELLKQGMERAKALRSGDAPWTRQTGLVARGYLSKIDGSVQPYGLVIPAGYIPGGPGRFRCDLWFHGRGENLSELNFIADRQRNPGEFTPPGAIVLHLYGRYCNANKFAGEIDTFEALDSVKRNYPIDENRIAARGFSMGGAACWQFTVHYPGEWAAGAPGAGFSETADFLKVFQKENVQPAWYEQKLWHMYDCTDYALNLFDVPTVAYSGEKDSQKQAADMMEKAAAKEGITLTHIIGPGAGHFYEAGAKREVSSRVDVIMAHGRNPVPPRIRFTTYTLRYNRCAWLALEGLGKHWEKARVDADIDSPDRITIKTSNVTAISLNFKPGECPLDISQKPVVMLDGQKIVAVAPASDRSWSAYFQKLNGRWAYDELRRVPLFRDDAKVGQPLLAKTPGLQGPIDDAFMDSFIMVRPTGAPMNEKVGAWVAKEQAHAIAHWRSQFRGEARQVDDTALTDEQIANSSLVLWGDPSSNKVLARIADKLPIKWDAQGVHVGVKTYAPDQHVPVMVYPNPLNPKRYVVLNSGFTYREYDYLNNARQVSKLPDWAVVDISSPVTSRLPGKIADAAFFGERWELTAERK